MDKENMNPQDLGGIFQEESSPSPPEESKRTYIKQEKTDKPYWYVVYTYSGYENKVMTNLLKTVVCTTASWMSRFRWKRPSK